MTTMPDRLNLNDNFFPIQTFFNAIGHESFGRCVNSLLDGVGYSINDCDCSFPSDLDPDEDPFDGVRFSVFEDEVVISEASLREYIKLACQAQLSLVPDQKNEVETILEKLE